MGMKQMVVLGSILVLVVLTSIVGLLLIVTKPSQTKTTDELDNVGVEDSTDLTSDKLNMIKKVKVKQTMTDTGNPLETPYNISALAIGDWGRTVQKDGGSCCTRRKDKSHTVMDYNAMEYTASLLGLAAQELLPVKPIVILGHGDNFYWSGLHSAKDQLYRFQQTFEEKYSDVSLDGIPWVNVMGNHDYGGSSFICSDENDLPRPCSSSSELLYYLNQKFELQSSYVSPNANRWIMSGHFFVHNIITASNVSIDIFNLDTNDADSHGANQICCQCYGYALGDDSGCNDVTRGHPYCVNGNTGMYDDCMKQLNSWGAESRDKLVQAVKSSKAKWKIVNTHYSPYSHFGPEGAKRWLDLLEGLNINVFFYGHTHGEKHDYSESIGTHFIENGAGGGIQNESPSGIPPYANNIVSNVWSAGNYPYGIFSWQVSSKWLKIRFLTFDNAWIMTKDLHASKVGGIAVKHCWYIPIDGSQGMSCEDAEERNASKKKVKN